MTIKLSISKIAYVFIYKEPQIRGSFLLLIALHTVLCKIQRRAYCVGKEAVMIIFEFVGQVGVLIFIVSFLGWFVIPQFVEWINEIKMNDYGFDPYNPDPPEVVIVVKIPDECGDFVCLIQKLGRS